VSVDRSFIRVKATLIAPNDDLTRHDDPRPALVCRRATDVPGV